MFKEARIDNYTAWLYSVVINALAWFYSYRGGQAHSRLRASQGCSGPSWNSHWSTTVLTMLSILSLAVLLAGLVQAQTTPPQPVSLSLGETPVGTTTYTTGGGVAAVPIYSAATASPSPTSYECWKYKDYGAGVSGSIPVPTYVLVNGVLSPSAASSGIECYESIPTDGVAVWVPVPTVANVVQPTPSSAEPTSSSSNLPLRVLLPSIIVPICSVAMVAIAVVLLRRRVVKSKGSERKWFTLKEEPTMSQSDKKSTLTGATLV